MSEFIPEPSPAFKLAEQLIERCEKDGVKFWMRTFLGLPTQDDALTVLCNARDMFEELLAHEKESG